MDEFEYYHQESKKSLDTIVSRLHHVTEHATQDQNLSIAAVFQFFLDVSHDFTEEEFADTIHVLKSIREKTKKLQGSS